MSGDRSSTPPVFDDQWRRSAEPLLDRFEADWRIETPPRFAGLLLEAPATVRARLATELALIDLERRLRAGAAVRAEDYRPLLLDPAALAELRAAEGRLRERLAADTPPARADTVPGDSPPAN